MGNSNLFNFTKIENKSDALKYALEFTAENGKPNYKEAKKLFNFIIKTVALPDTKNMWEEIYKTLDTLKPNSTAQEQK